MNQQQGTTEPQSKRGKKKNKKHKTKKQKTWLWGAEFRQMWNLVRGRV